jgi:gas vesicle protein
MLVDMSGLLVCYPQILFVAKIYNDSMDLGDIISGLFILGILGGAAALVYYLTRPAPGDGVRSIIVTVKGIPYAETYNDKIISGLQAYEGTAKITTDMTDDVKWVDKKTYTHVFSLTDATKITKLSFNVKTFPTDQTPVIKMTFDGYAGGKSIDKVFTLLQGEYRILYPGIWSPDTPYRVATKYVVVSQKIGSTTQDVAGIKAKIWSDTTASALESFEQASATSTTIKEFVVAGAVAGVATITTPGTVHRILVSADPTKGWTGIAASPLTVSLYDANKALVESFTQTENVALFVSNVNSPANLYSPVPALLKLTYSAGSAALTSTSVSLEGPLFSDTNAIDAARTVYQVSGSSPLVGFVSLATTQPFTTVKGLTGVTTLSATDLNGKVISSTIANNVATLAL